MTGREVDKVLAYLSATIERRSPMSEATVIAWEQQFADVDHLVAQRAAYEWCKGNRWFPTISEFREACRVAARHLETEALVAAKNKPAELEEPPCAPERVSEHVAKCKELLRAKGVRC